MSRKSSVALAALTAFAAFTSGPAGAQDATREFPQRPIRFIVPYAPGGATDIVARLLGPKLTDLLNQQIVIDNRVGASGNIALELVARAAPDGYTLLIGNVSTNSINPVAFAKTLKFDPAKELTGITLLASIPNLLVAGAAFPPNTLKEAIAYTKARPGQLNHGGPIGSYAHLDLLALLNSTGMQMVHVPSKGGAGTAVTTLVNGEIHYTWMNVATALPQVKAGRFKAYAVSTAQRLPELPNVPTMTEEGFAGIGSNNWNGLFAPARTPKPVIDRLFTVTTTVLQRPEVQEAFAKNQIPVALSQSPDEFNRFVQAEMRKWVKILKESPVAFE
jgi:tripartite-type tricarboxylate transporter receptor subunit TctC